MMNSKGLVGKDIPPQANSGAPLVLLATREGGELEPYQDFQDITLADYRAAIDYLVSILTWSFSFPRLVFGKRKGGILLSGLAE